MARQATDAEKKLQNSHYDRKKKSWDLDKYVAHQKEPHTIIESLVDHGNSGIDKGTKVCHFLKESRVLSWRLESMLSKPNQRSMAKISMQLCLILVR